MSFIHNLVEWYGKKRTAKGARVLADSRSSNPWIPTSRREPWLSLRQNLSACGVRLLVRQQRPHSEAVISFMLEQLLVEDANMLLVMRELATREAAVERLREYRATLREALGLLGVQTGVNE